MRKRVLVIGPEGSGKRTLVSLIENRRDLSKKHSIVYYEESILVPSSYLRSPGMIHHIIATQQRADAVVMMLSSLRDYRVYSPNFARVFRVPTIGIISCHSNENKRTLKDCHQELVDAGLEEIIDIDFTSTEQCQRLLDKINRIREGR